MGLQARALERALGSTLKLLGCVSLSSRMGRSCFCTLGFLLTGSSVGRNWGPFRGSALLLVLEHS